MVYDGAWIFKESLQTNEGDRFDECFENHQTFATLEEAQEEYNRRANGEYCGVYNVECIRLEECGGDEDDDEEGSYPIDTIEYWERCNTEEFKNECLANQ